ncbi:hypothetical protein A0H76_1021 [Hepatospora eriocheir]|uniref:Uncharacterized protein n=1 Tax=Hepatospora eriocheir TaxID=1081669 RepID=A0A1X0Q679_9MICR|nr:hypothetical protein A0H76_1021 [Hepatospora eriocheir]
MSSNDMSIPLIQIILNSPVFSLILLLILIGKKLSLFQNLNKASLNPKDTPIQLIFLLKIFKEISDFTNSSNSFIILLPYPLDCNSILVAILTILKP